MTELSPESVAWLWDFKHQQPHIRPWPAVTKGAVHIRDVSDLGILREVAAEVADEDAWADTYQRIMTSDRFTVAVDTLADMMDHNREDCLGTLANLKGYSQSIFALERGEILTQLPFPARLALLADGLVTIETSAYEHDPRQALEELTVADLQLLARQTTHINLKQRKAELIDELVKAEDLGEVELPLGDISPAPPLHGWLEGLVQRYVQALLDALARPVYPDVYKEAVYHQAINQTPFGALKRALELEYWAILERGIEAQEEDPEDIEAPASHLNYNPTPATRGHWEPAIAPNNRDAPVMWVAVGLMVIAWLFF
ncbi:MAG: hypothetical protein WED11_03805 [Natronospirillum sp.]